MDKKASINEGRKIIFLKFGVSDSFRIFATYEILGRYLVKEYKRIVC